MKKIIVSCAIVLCGAVLGAQNLDPTVEVSRVYEGRLIEVHKPVIDMTVPDTLYRFDQDFDYSVFSNPYRGAYEFNPYMMDMKPVNNSARPSRLYLCAGAGYTLHPVFDVLWSPDIKGGFNVDVYGKHRSYVGGYRPVAGNAAFSGYDLLSEVGADAGYDWKKAALGFGVSYCGIAVEDLVKRRSYNAVDAYVSLKSKSLWPDHFMYDLGLGYRYAEDSSLKKLASHEFSFDVSVGPRPRRSHKMFFDVDVDMNVYSGAVEATAAGFGFTPHYIYDRGRLHIDLGLNLAVVLVGGADLRYEDMKSRNFSQQYLYPDVRMYLDIAPDALRFKVNAGGGTRMNSYASHLRSNHHFDLGYAVGDPMSLFCPTVERVAADAGFEGRISRFFSYDLRGGYVNYMGAPLDAALEVEAGRYMPRLGYSAYQKCYASLDWELDVRTVRFDGNVTYNHCWGMAADVFGPAKLTADAEIMYNWRERVYAGVSCRYSHSRSNLQGLSVPWYVDLGLFAEYVLNRKFSFWLRGGNLLNMEIQRNLFFAEKGVNVTAGISLNL